MVIKEDTEKKLLEKMKKINTVKDLDNLPLSKFELNYLKKAEIYAKFDFKIYEEYYKEWDMMDTECGPSKKGQQRDYYRKGNLVAFERESSRSYDGNNKTFKGYDLYIVDNKKLVLFSVWNRSWSDHSLDKSSVSKEVELLVTYNKNGLVEVKE